MPLRRETCRFPVIINIIGILILAASCNASKTTAVDKKAYQVVNAFLDYYVEETNQGVFLSPLVIEKENHAIKNVFNEEGQIHKEICDTESVNISLTNDDFNNYLKTQHLNTWNYKKIKNKEVIKNLVLEDAARITYMEARERGMLKRENEWITYKYILWHNKKNVPLITLSYPLFSEDRNYAILYMTKYQGGGYVFVFKKENPKKWKIICEKNLFQY